MHIAAGQLFHRRRNRRTEQQRLTRLRALAENLFDVRAEADIEHPVGFVEHRQFDIVELQRAASHVIENSTRRTDDHLRPAFQLLNF